MFSEVVNATCLMVNRRRVERGQNKHNSVNKEFSELFMKFFEWFGIVSIFRHEKAAANN